MSSEPIKVLIVDDDGLAARMLATHLSQPGRFETEVAASGEDALTRIYGGGIHAVVSDLAMPGVDGIELARRAREAEPFLPVVILTAHGSLERAVEAIRQGASDFLQKPANVTALRALIERAVRERPVREEVAARASGLGTPGSRRLLGGDHPRLDAVRTFAEQVARVLDARVLITGETGTGKSLLAEAIHHLSACQGRFVEVNCAALPPQLMESELFGHEKGAFTDAHATKRGLVEQADRGTLLMDEIGSLPLELQAKLLSFLERRQIRRVGGIEPIPVRCRLIAATNEDLRERVRERTFRQDLFYRLEVAAVEMPPLREMPSIIPELAERFTIEISRDFCRPAPELGRQSFADLVTHSWPGNIRELRNTVERSLIFHEGGPLVVLPTPSDPSLEGQKRGMVIPFDLGLEDVERLYIEAMLERHCDGRIMDVARHLGVSRKTLWEKRRRYQLT